MPNMEKHVEVRYIDRWHMKMGNILTFEKHIDMKKKEDSTMNMGKWQKNNIREKGLHEYTRDFKIEMRPCIDRMIYIGETWKHKKLELSKWENGKMGKWENEKKLRQEKHGYINTQGF